MLRAIRAAFAWLEKHALWLLLLAAGVSTGAALLRNKASAVNTARAALAVQRAKDQLDALKKQARMIAAVDEAKANEVLKLSDAINRRKKDIVELYSGKPWAEMSDAEIEQALHDAGV